MTRLAPFVLLAAIALLLAPLAARSEEFDACRVAGKVTDKNGQPLFEAKVIVNQTEGARRDPANIQQAQTLTDREGNYEITLRFAKGESLIVKEVIATLKGYVTASPPLRLKLADEQQGKVDFQLATGEIISGQIQLPLLSTERRRPKESIVRILEVSGPNYDHVSLNARCESIGADGKFEVTVPPGRYTLRVHAYGRGTPQWNDIQSGHRDLVLGLPKFKWNEQSVGQAYDLLCETMDRNYSYFYLKKDVDWRQLTARFRPAAVRATNGEQLAQTLIEMLAHLNDMHVWIETPKGMIGTLKGGYNYNGNRQIVLDQLEDQVQCGKFAVVGKTRQDGFGCFVMLSQSEADSESVATAVDAIRKLADAPGFVVDLRTANGGAEPLAQQIATVFCARPTVYAKSKYRGGNQHDQFGETYERYLYPSPKTYVKPIVCLIGPGAVSSGEAFVQMMRCLPNVVTVGLPTRGASGNPRPCELPGTELTVYFSSWVDMLPDGTAIEGVGIAPTVAVNAQSGAYKAADPTWEKGLEVLRDKVREKKRPTPAEPDPK